jgi:hypothetical protein
MLGDERIQLGDDLPMPGGAEIGLDPVFDDAEAPLLEPLSLTP